MKSLGAVSTPSAIVPQLSRFLAVYYTKAKGESISTWTAAIKAVTSSAAWPLVQPTIGLPAGWVSKGVPLTQNVVTQNQNTPGEVYVIMQVSVTLTDPSGATQTYTYNTGSEWIDRGNQWTMLTFAGAPAGGG